MMAMLSRWKTPVPAAYLVHNMSWLCGFALTMRHPAWTCFFVVCFAFFGYANAAASWSADSTRSRYQYQEPAWLDDPHQLYNTVRFANDRMLWYPRLGASVARFVNRLYRLLVREPTSGQRLSVTMVNHTAVSFVLEPPPPSKHLLVNMYLLSK
ncbi:hypothetical protein C8Q74DRAFT_976334 [Fomes fomentarius]|nr:hypothetical protein C8Q74DRAFT_976334 [Fomes fomentarius]